MLDTPLSAPSGQEANSPSDDSNASLLDDCKKLSAILARENDFVSLSNLQLWAGLSHESAVLALRHLYQRGALDYISGNGSGNARYRIKTDAAAKYPSAAKPLVVPAFIEPALKDLPAVEKVVKSRAPATPAPVAPLVPAVRALEKIKPAKPKGRAPAAIPRLQPPAWANPLPEPLSVLDLGWAKNRVVFSLSRRPGGINFTMQSKHAKLIAQSILGLDPRQKSELPGRLHEVECERVTSIGTLIIVRISHRPGVNRMVMLRSQAHDMARQILALR